MTDPLVIALDHERAPTGEWVLTHPSCQNLTRGTRIMLVRAVAGHTDDPVEPAGPASADPVAAIIVGRHNTYPTAIPLEEHPMTDTAATNELADIITNLRDLLADTHRLAIAAGEADIPLHQVGSHLAAASAELARAVLVAGAEQRRSQLIADYADTHRPAFLADRSRP